MSDAAALERLTIGRHSCRAFRPDPVPQSVIESILSLAQRTASWCNAQPWHVIITSGAATERFRTMLRGAAEQRSSPDIAWPEGYPGVHADRRRMCGLQLYEAVGVVRGDRAASGRQALRNFALFDAPHAAIVTSERALGTYGAIDCGGYVANFLLAAQAHGVSTIAQAALAAHAPSIRAHLAIPANRIIICGISFGYEDADHPANSFRTDRATLEEAATFVSA